jgi:plastocyanin
MRRASISVVAVLALLVAAVAIGANAGGATTPPVKRVSITGTACANGFFCYKPAAITVFRGTRVVWTNNSGVMHTVTRCSKVPCGVTGGTGRQTGLSSPDIQPHRTYAFLFRLPGTYRYYCKVHGYGLMHGIVTVK